MYCYYVTIVMYLFYLGLYFDNSDVMSYFPFYLLLVIGNLMFLAAKAYMDWGTSGFMNGQRIGMWAVTSILTVAILI